MNPFGAEDICSKFVIDDSTNPFILRKVTVASQQYTLSCWIRSEAEGTLVVAGTEIPTTTEWQKQVVLFDATDTNLILTFAAGTYYLYHTKLEIGNKDTDWSPNPDDIESDLAETNLDLNKAKTLIQQNKEAITLLATSEEFGELEKRVKTAEQKLTADGIKTIVGTYYATASSVSEIQSTFEQTAEALTVKITDAAKTATNFLKYDGGLIVGEIPQADDETLGNNVLITTSGVNIRNGDAVLAKFEKDKISLGLDAKLSTINLLNGAAILSATVNEANHTEFVLDGADYILLRSQETTSGWSAASRIYMTSESVRLLTTVEYSDGSTTGAALYIEGNSVTLGYGTSFDSDSSDFCINSKGGALFTDLVSIQKNGVTTTIGSYNNGWSHFQTGGSTPFYFDSPLHAVSKIQVYGSNTYIYNGGLAVGDTTYNDGYIELKGGTPYIDFHYDADNIDSDYTSRIIESSSGTLTFMANLSASGNIYSEGYLSCAGRIKSINTYNTTGTAAANVVISSSYWTYRSTSSSKRYKHDIGSLGEELNSEKLLGIPVHRYIYNLDYIDEADQRYNTEIPGFIAEEVYEHYPIAAEIVDGQIEDWNQRMIIPPMLDLIQKLWKRVDELGQKIS